MTRYDCSVKCGVMALYDDSCVKYGDMSRYHCNVGSWPYITAVSCGGHGSVSILCEV